MITITTNAKDVANFMRKAVVNIKRSQTRIATTLTEVARNRVVANAPVWSGNLKGKVAMKIFPRTHTGEVFMMGSRANMEALENELNYSGRRKLYKVDYPHLEQWAIDKQVFLNQRYVIVGGTNTRFGKTNKFFEPAFIQTVRGAPQVVAAEIAKALMMTRG